MKNKEIQRLLKGLEAVKNLPGAKFAYAVGRNLNKLKPISDSIDKSLKMPDEYQKYQEEHERCRLELCKQHAKKDENGEPISEVVEIGNGKKQKRYVFEDKAAFDEAYTFMCTGLKTEYADMFVEMEQNYKDFQAFLEEELAEELILHMVKSDNLPEAITGEQIDNIIEIIE